MPNSNKNLPVPGYAQGGFTETAKQLYDRLASERAPYITRAGRCALVTIPSLFPKNGTNGSTEFVVPQQSLGARGINCLTAKMMNTTFPASMPFLRLEVSAPLKKEAQDKGMVNQLALMEYQLSQQERSVMKYMAAKQYRPTLTEVYKQLLVAGNCLTYQPPKEGGIKAYKLYDYVCARDGLGKPYTIVTVDHFAYASLTEELRAIADQKGNKKPDDTVDVYTHIFKGDDKFWYSYQEIEGEIIDGTAGKYPEKLLPWNPVRLVKIDGESYGRSYVEEYLGDLESVDALTKAIVSYAAVASRIIHMVNPNGTTRARVIAKALTGEFVSGRREDITTLSLEKSQDFQTSFSVLQQLKTDISFAFLLNTAVQRNAERVTAEEIRFMGQELEETLGGMYALLSEELQQPIATCVIQQMQHLGVFPSLPDGTVETSIITGVDALGRGQDLNNLNQFIQYFQNLPDAQLYMKVDGLLQKAATSLSIDVSDIMRTKEEVQQQQQMMNQQQLLTQVAPTLADGAMKGALTANG